MFGLFSCARRRTLSGPVRCFAGQAGGAVSRSASRRLDGQNCFSGAQEQRARGRGHSAAGSLRGIVRPVRAQTSGDSKVGGGGLMRWKRPTDQCTAAGLPESTFNRSTLSERIIRRLVLPGRQELLAGYDTWGHQWNPLSPPVNSRAQGSIHHEIRMPGQTPAPSGRIQGTIHTRHPVDE